MGVLAPVRPCTHCGLDFKPIKGNHGGLCSTLCRFLSKVAFAENECWEWTAAKNSDGYGLFNSPGHSKAHRYAFAEIGGGVLVDGLTIDHLCRNRACVNPNHMEQVTHAENMHRSAGHRNETHCRKGLHELTEENTGWFAGKRYCRQCKRDREAPAARAYRARRKAQTNA